MLNSLLLQQMTIVPAHSISQLETIEKLAWEIIPEFYAAYIPSEHCIFFVQKFQTLDAIRQQIANGFEYYLISAGNKIAGYLGLHPSAEKILLSKLYLLKSCRGKGMGTFVMDFVDKRALQNGTPLIELEVSEHNKETITFYKNKGFSIRELVIHNYENGYSIGDYRMTKLISQ